MMLIETTRIEPWSDRMTTAQHIDTEEIRYLQRQLENADPQEILRWAAEQYGQQLAVVTSFQPTGIVTLHMLNEIAPRTPVITLDTEFLFPETYALMNQVEALFDLNLIRVKPQISVAQQAAQYGDNLWQSNPDQCCHMRKTLPLKQALTGYAAWITGLRRDQSSTRANVPVIAWDSRNNLLKLCPFASWTEEMIWTYIHAHELPYNDLHNQGYPSIGCTHCTQAPVDSSDLRSGRWVNHQKTECGIHVTLVEEVRTN